MTRKLLILAGLTLALLRPVMAQRPDSGPPAIAPSAIAHSATASPLADVTTNQVLDLPGRLLRFTATVGSIRLRDSKDAR